VYILIADALSTTDVAADSGFRSRTRDAVNTGIGGLNGTRISERSLARGLGSLDALKLAVLQQRRTWWQGRSYHCGLCDLDFLDPQIAAEHVVTAQHPVLRMD
jgi:hypothetical protein